LLRPLKIQQAKKNARNALNNQTKILVGGHWTTFLFVMIKTFIGGLSRLLDHNSVSHIGLKTKGTQDGRFFF